MLCDEENLGEYIEKEQFTIDILGFKIFNGGSGWIIWIKRYLNCFPEE